MAKMVICDICGKPTDQVAAKLWYAPTEGPQRVERYTHHLDVGDCCHHKVMNQFKWHKRQTATQYRNRNRRKVAS